MGEKKRWGWKEAGKGVGGSGSWGRATGRDMWWADVKEEEDGK